MPLRHLLTGMLAALAVASALLLGAAPGDAPAAPASDAPPTFHCRLDATCPEVMIAGDPYARLGGDPAPFRGYGDPSLEYDPATDALWLSYSWLDVLMSDPGPPPQIDFGVRTHLARSDDGGASFSFVKSVNETAALNHPDSGTPGWAIHEVSTLLREAPDTWQMLWLTYFDPYGEPPPDRSDFYYRRSVASSPEGLGPSAAWIRGNGTSPSFGAQYNLSTIPQLSDCVAFTEPALFSQAGVMYLATNCVVFQDGVRHDELERLVLLRQEANGYSYVGALLTSADAAYLGATRIEQADIAYSRTGHVLLIATPIEAGTPEHLGCVVFEIADIAMAQVRRDTGGQAVQLARITGDDASIGPGLCTYDAASETGVLMVLHIFNEDPSDLEFSLRATGVHPDASPRAVGGIAELSEPPSSSEVGEDARHVALATAATLVAVMGGVVLFIRRRGLRP